MHKIDQGAEQDCNVEQYMSAVAVAPFSIS